MTRYFSKWRSLSSCIRQTLRFKRTKARLVEVGEVEPFNENGTPYISGQLFINRAMDYRGVVLFPCSCKLVNKDINPKDESSQDFNNNYFYYLCLVDLRDDKKSYNTVSEIPHDIPGMDVVAHEDVLPYHSKEDWPIIHNNIDKLLVKEKPSDYQFVPTDLLLDWQAQNMAYPWLQPTTVYRQTTKQIRVTVIPTFFFKTNANHVWWRYFVHIENLGSETVQLRKVKLKILTPGAQEPVYTETHRGVVNCEPVLSPKNPAFFYYNHVSLKSTSGRMWGYYVMEKEDRSTFNCDIPSFRLESSYNVLS